MTSWAESDGKGHGSRPSCKNCGGLIRPRSNWVHPWTHIESGKHSCPPVTKAEPMTLQERDAEAYVADLVREAGYLADRADALLAAARTIMEKLARGETYNL